MTVETGSTVAQDAHYSPDLPSGQRYRLIGRRLVFATLVGSSIVGAVFAFGSLMAGDGFSWFDGLMLTCFAVTLPWVIIGFWNAVIGLILLSTRKDAAQAVNPLLAQVDPTTPLVERTAIVMPAYNEDPHRVFANLDAMDRSLRMAGEADIFDFHLLSDTQDPEIAAKEARAFENWKASHPNPERLFYRRREDNSGHKTGNLWEFVDRVGETYTYMIVMDADSLMTAPALARMVRVMQTHPNLGILQTLAVGLPSRSLFCRLFQYGMRQSMRPYTLGSAWWQGPDGPYWGHNAILRVDAFRKACKLPVLPGKAPLGGEILSHDQVEAAKMRTHGYEVRVLAEEGGSFEENPPTLPDFIMRDLRWCQGNMQYLQLLFMPGFKAMGRVQLLLAIWMYVAAPFWLTFMALGIGYAVGAGPQGFSLNGAGPAIALFGVMMSMTFMPKIVGVIDVLMRPPVRKSYGGTTAVLKGAVSETAFSMLIAPVIAVAQAVFMIGLFLGRRIVWNAQQRDGHRITWRQGVRCMWLQTLIGVVATVALAWRAPHILPWATPVLLGLTLSIPLTVITSVGSLGRWAARFGLCALPEEKMVPREIRWVRPTLPWTLSRARRARRRDADLVVRPAE